MTEFHGRNLEKGVHYDEAIDLSEIFKAGNPRFGNFDYISLAKLVFALLPKDHSSNFQKAHHDPIADAKFSLLIYEHYVTTNRVDAAKSILRTHLYQKKFPRINPTTPEDIDGVCPYGFNPDKCICGQPTLRRD